MSQGNSVRKNGVRGAVIRRLGVRALCCAMVLGAAACGAPQGPHIRYVQATPEQLAAVEGERMVWYEFQPGDEVPMGFAFLGMAEMGSDSLRMRVQRPFWIVVFESGRTSFSFDGRTLVDNPFSRWGMMIGRGEQRGTTALLMYVGPANEAPAALRR